MLSATQGIWQSGEAITGKEIGEALEATDHHHTRHFDFQDRHQTLRNELCVMLTMGKVVVWLREYKGKFLLPVLKGHSPVYLLQRSRRLLSLEV
jgi:hypothetical protein